MVIQFQDCESLTSIIIPEPVRTIGGYAFNRCITLATVEFMGNNIEVLEEGTFYDCIKLATVKTTVQTEANKVSVPTSIETIEKYAFFNNVVMDNIVIPNNVELMGHAVFGGCEAITNITLPFVGASRYATNNNDSTTFAYIFGMVDTLSTIDDDNSPELKNPSKFDVITQNDIEFFIPKTLVNVTITDDNAIKAYAFENCGNLTNVTLPLGYNGANDFTHVYNNAFRNCVKLEAIIFPNTTEYIGQYAFENCSSLTEVVIPQSVIAIDDYAFKDATKLEKVTYEAGIDLDIISEGVFYNCINLSTILSDSSVSILSDTSNAAASLPRSVVEIEDYAFYNCYSMTSLTIPNDSLTTIGKAILAGCSGLKYLSIPFIAASSDYATCSHDSTVHSDDETTLFGYLFGFDGQLDTTNITNINNGFDLVTQKFSANDSRLSYIPKSLTDVVLTDVECIHYGTFYNCFNLVNVLLPDNLEVIGDYAFYSDYEASGNNNSKLTSVNCLDGNFDSLYVIGEAAFKNCDSLVQFNSNVEEVVIPSKVSALYNEVFRNCNRISTITISASVGVDGEYEGLVGEYVFADCDSLSSITINNHWIGAHMFDNSDNFPEDFDYDTDYPKPLLEHVTIPSNVTRIDEYAFANNEQLLTVTINNKLLGEYMFYNCPRLNYVVIPDDVTEIGKGAFGACTGLTELTIPFVGRAIDATNGEDLFGYIFGTDDTVVDRGVHATEQFYNESEFVTYYIPSSLVKVTVTIDKEFGYGAFNNCIYLTDIIMPTGSQFTKIYAHALDNCSSVKSLVIPAYVETIGEYAFKDCQSMTSFEFEGTLMTTLEEGLFYNCYSLVTMKVVDESENEDDVINVSDSIKTIGDYVFFNNISMKEVTISENVDEIGLAIFGGCTSLEYMTVPFIGNKMINAEDVRNQVDGYFASENILFGYFFGSSNENFKNKNIYPIRQFYSQTAYIDYYIPTSVKYVNITKQDILQYGTFYDCNDIVEVTLPINLYAIAHYAFFDCQRLRTVNLLNGDGDLRLLYIGRYAFYNCAEFRYFNHIEETDQYDVHLPNTLRYLQEYAFYNCENIHSLIIPESLDYSYVYQYTSIGSYAFASCRELKIVKIENNILSDHVFYDCPSIETLVVPSDTISIGYAAFGACTSLTSLTVPFIGGINYTEAKEEALLGYVFGKEKTPDVIDLETSRAVVQRYSDDMTTEATYYIPKSLKTVNITNDVYVGYGAFMNCEDLENVTLSKSRTSSTTTISFQAIKDYAFYNCHSLKELVIPSSTTYLGSYAFYENDNLAKVTFEGSKITTINDYTFYGCDVLNDINKDSDANVNITNGVTSIGVSAFENCSSIASVELPSGITKLDHYAFKSTTSLVSVNLPQGITYLGDEVFMNAESLKSIVIPSSVTEYVGEYAFANTYSLSSITINNAIISDHMFDSATKNVTSGVALELESQINSIGDYAFVNTTGLTSLVLDGNDSTTYGDYIFANSGLTDVTVNASMATTTVAGNPTGKYMFMNNTSLTTVEFTSNSITQINEGTFQNANALTGFVIPNSIVTIANYAFDNAFADTLSQARTYSLRNNVIEISFPENVHTIGMYAFRDNSNIQNLVIPFNVKVIEYGAFNGCGGITEITLPFIGRSNDEAEFSESSLFGYIFGKEEFVDGNDLQITQFTKVNPDCVDGIYGNEGMSFTDPVNYEFYIPVGLAKINLTDLTVIKNGALSGITNVYNVTLPYGLKEIHTAAFSGLHNLTDIEIPLGCTTLQSAVFEDINDDFFITAFYDVMGDPSVSETPVPGTRPAGWYPSKEVEVDYRWHTKYIVWVDDIFAQIFIFNYVKEGDYFEIIGYADGMKNYLLTHNGIIRIPEYRAGRPVEEITDRAFYDYPHTGNAEIKGIDIAENVLRIGDDILKGSPNLKVYIRNDIDFTGDNNYISTDAQSLERWLNQGVVYFGYDRMWTMVDAWYELLIDAMDVDLIVYDENEEQDEWKVEYTGYEITNDENNATRIIPVLIDTGIVVGGANKPTYSVDSEYMVEYADNFHVTENAQVILKANYLNNTFVRYSESDSRTVNIKYFEIYQSTLTLDIQESKVFEEGEHWTHSEWNYDNILGFQTANEVFTGILASNSVNRNTYTLDSEFNWDLEAWKVVNADGIDVTQNYKLSFGDFVNTNVGVEITITPKPVIVAWEDTRIEYDVDGLIMPDAYVETHPDYPELPLDIYIYTNKTNVLKAIIKSTGEVINYNEDGTTSTTDTFTLENVGYYVLVARVNDEIIYEDGIFEDGTVRSQNYTLLVNNTSFYVDSKVIEIPSVHNQMVYDGESQYPILSSSNAYKYYVLKSNPFGLVETPAEGEEDPLDNFDANFRLLDSSELQFINAGNYYVYAKLVNDNYRWEDYKDPLFRSQIVCVKIVVSKRVMNVDFGDLEIERSDEKYTINITPEMLSNLVDGDPVLEGTITVDRLNVGLIDYEDILAGANFTNYNSTNYDLLVIGTINVQLPALDVNYNEEVHFDFNEDIDPSQLLVTSNDPTAIVTYTYNGISQNTPFTQYVNGYQTNYAGTYTVMFKVESDEYMDYEGSYKVIIDKINHIVSWDERIIGNGETPLNYTYNGTSYTVSDINLTCTTSLEEPSIVIGKIIDGVTTPVNSIQNAGKYIVSVFIPTNENFKEFVKSFEINISKKSLEVVYGDETKPEEVPFEGALIRDNVTVEGRVYQVIIDDATGLINGDKLYLSYSTLDNEVGTYSYDLGTLIPNIAIYRGNVNVTDSYSWTIESICVNIVPSFAEILIEEAKDDTLTKVYDAETFMDPEVLTNSTGVITYEYYLNGVKLDSNPIYAGNYTLLVTVEGDSNTKTASKEYSVIITPRDIKLIVIGQNVYNGQIVYPNVDVLDYDKDVEFSYELVSGYNGINAGEQRVIASVSTIDKDSYNIINPEVIYNINKRPLTISVNKEVYYDNANIISINADELVLEGLIDGDTITGTITTLSGEAGIYSQANQFDLSNLIITNVENYEITYNLYVYISYPDVPYTIDTEGASEFIQTGDNVYTLRYVYDNQLHRAKVVPSIEGARVSYTYDGRTIYSPFSQLEAGYKRITFKITADNYEDTTGVIHLYVDRVQLDINYTDLSKDFDGLRVNYEELAFPIQVKPIVTYYKVEETTDENGDVVYNIIGKINAPSLTGVYMIQIQVFDTENYIGFIKQEYFRIGKSDLTISIPESYLTQEYTGEPVRNPNVMTYTTNTDKITFTYYAYDESNNT